MVRDGEGHDRAADGFSAGRKPVGMARHDAGLGRGTRWRLGSHECCSCGRFPSACCLDCTEPDQPTATSTVPSDPYAGNGTVVGDVTHWTWPHSGSVSNGVGWGSCCVARNRNVDRSTGTSASANTIFNGAMRRMHEQLHNSSAAEHLAAHPRHSRHPTDPCTAGSPRTAHSRDWRAASASKHLFAHSGNPWVASDPSAAGATRTSNHRGWVGFADSAVDLAAHPWYTGDTAYSSAAVTSRSTDVPARLAKEEPCRPD